MSTEERSALAVPRTEPPPSADRGHQQYDDVTCAVREFVYGYYLTLAGSPHEAWRFFADGAQYTHVDGQGPAEARDLRPAVGQCQVHENIVYQRFAECEFLIRSVNVQLMPGGGCLALVTGDMSRGGCPPVRFVQSLAMERVPRRHRAEADDRYAITNSILKVYTRCDGGGGVDDAD